MDDDHPSATVGQHAAGLFLNVVPVHRHAVRTNATGAEAGLEECEVVAKNERDRVTAAHAQRLEAGGCARGALVERRGVPAAFAADDKVAHKPTSWSKAIGLTPPSGTERRLRSGRTRALIGARSPRRARRSCASSQRLAGFRDRRPPAGSV